jgi:hypothetical protein
MICTCGDPTTLGVVHLRDRPCFHYVEREWVPLTDEEFEEVINELGKDPRILAVEIEIRLMEKNT